MAKLSQLFDLHKIAGNAELQNIIDDTHKRYPQMTELSDDDLELAAAGRGGTQTEFVCPKCKRNIAFVPDINNPGKMKCPYCDAEE